MWLKNMLIPSTEYLAEYGGVCPLDLPPGFAIKFASYDPPCSADAWI